MALGRVAQSAQQDSDSEHRALRRAKLRMTPGGAILNKETINRRDKP
jgi:hypothetical protein